MKNTTILERTFWIFDLDGTLTIPKHDFAHIRRVLGIPQDKDILGFLAEQPETERTRLHGILNEMELQIARETEAAVGAQELVVRLHRRGVKMGILTRNTRKHAILSLAAIDLDTYFPAHMVYGRDEAKPKPHPDGIHQLLAQENEDSDNAVMIGDYLFDLQTGRAAGTGTIHVDTTGQFPWPDLTDLGVDTLTDLTGQLP